MKSKTCRLLLAFLTITALLTCIIPASAAQASPFTWNVSGFEPQHGLNITFYRAQGTSFTPGMGRIFLPYDLVWGSLEDSPVNPEGKASVVKTGLWTSGTQFTQAALTASGQEGLSWAGLTDQNWAQIEGYLWLPKNHDLSANGDFLSLACGANTRAKLWVDGQLRVDWWDQSGSLERDPTGWSIEIPRLQPNRHIQIGYTGAPVHIRLVIGAKTVDSAQRSGLYWSADCSMGYYRLDTRGWRNNYTYQHTEIDPSLSYPNYPIEGFKQLVQIDDFNDTVTVTSTPYGVDPSRYEFGVINGANETWSITSSQVGPIAGQSAVREKENHYSLAVLGTLTTPAPRDVVVTKRMPRTATLKWTAPLCSQTPQTYEIYRKVVGGDASFGTAAIVVISVSASPDKVGSTTDLTFTDQGLTYNDIYEYRVRAVYESAHADSAPVRTDTVPLEGIPTAPQGLRVTSNTGRELVLQWEAVKDAKEYIVRREYISMPAMIVMLVGQETVGRTSATTFRDTGMTQGAKCSYWVQAVDSDGIPSRLGQGVQATIPDVTPPTPPGNFVILNDGQTLLLGPSREVTMRWDSSTDNIMYPGVVGYDILRAAAGYDGTKPGSAGLWGEPTHKVGSTEGTTFTDSGLESGAYYTYYVVAKDAAGNTSESHASVMTDCPYLRGLAAMGDGKTLELLPSFQYAQGEYALAVDNETKSLTLNPKRIDPKSTVTVDGQQVSYGDLAGPFPLEIGENRFQIEVVGRPSFLLWEPARMMYTVAVTRANLAELPVLTLPLDSAPIPEGSVYEASGSITKVTTSPWVGTVDYGDGTIPEVVVVRDDGTFDLRHTYKDDGLYQAKVAFTYADLGLVTATTPVAVTNVAPAIEMRNGVQEYTVDEGSVLGLAGSIVDPGADKWTLTADFDDSLGPVAIPVNADGTFYIERTFYDEKPSYRVVLAVADDDGGTGASTLKVTVTNVPPTVNAGPGAVAQRDVVFQRQGSFVDPGHDTWTGFVDFGDGSGEQPLALGQDKTFLLEHVYPQNGYYDVTIRVEDNDGGAGVTGFPVTVKDFIFSIDAGADAQVNEGEVLQRTAQVTGPAEKAVSVTVDYGDGTAKERLALEPGATDCSSRTGNRT